MFSTDQIDTDIARKHKLAREARARLMASKLAWSGIPHLWQRGLLSDSEAAAFLLRIDPSLNVGQLVSIMRGR